MRMKGARAICEALKKEKVKHIFGLPGGAIMPFYDALLDYPEITHYLVRHEQGAAHAAEGYARASGKVGVCVATSGPGATNLTTGLADAYMDSVPIIAMTGQVIRSLIGNDAFQEADIFGITMPITKHNFKVMNPEELPKILKMAFTIATAGRPGPVAIDLPKDVQNAEIEFNYPETITIPGYQPKYEPHPIQVKKAVEVLISAERPVILAGGGVIISGAHKEIARLSEVLFAPVVYTLMAKGVMDDTHPLCLGPVGMHGRIGANTALTLADVVLAVGCRFDDRVTGDIRYFAPHAKIIHVDIDAAEIGKNVKADVPIQGDAKRALTAILAGLEKAKKKESEWSRRCRELKEACNCNYGALENVPLHPARVIKELNQHVPKERTIFVTEVGQNQMWAMHFIEAGEPRHFISSGGLGTMGFGLPASIGAKAARPDMHVIDIAGDGSVLMTNQEIATSVHYGLPVLICILNNGWLGMVKQWQKLFMEKRYSHTKLHPLPDFVKLFQSYGGDGERVERPSELKEAIKRGLKSDVIYALDIVIDPEIDVLPMVPAGGRNDRMIPSPLCSKVEALSRKMLGIG